MTMNANLMNAICENAANAIAIEIPDFGDWYEGLDEYRTLMNSDFAKEYLGKIDEAVVSHDTTALGLRAVNKLVNGSTVDEQELNEMRERRERLSEFTEFFTTAHAVYTNIDCAINSIVSHVSNGDFDKAMACYNEMKRYRPDGISNPLAGIDMVSIKNEIRSTQCECAMIDAKNDAARKTAREIAEGAKNGYAIIGAAAALTADIILGVKVLKKIFK